MATKQTDDDDHTGEENAYARAYAYGYASAYPMDVFTAENTHPGLSPMDGITDTARWANHILPRLRQMAGFDDPSGVGTYTSAPSEDAHFLFDELVDEFSNGYCDRACGRAYGTYAELAPDDALESMKRKEGIDE